MFTACNAFNNTLKENQLLWVENTDITENYTATTIFYIFAFLSKSHD